MTSAMSFSSGVSPRACIGSLRVSVVKASGVVFESGLKHRIRLSVGSSQQCQTKLVRHPSLQSKKPLQFNEEFTFDIALPTDFLAVTCVRGSSKSTESDTQVGALTIALAHLPQSTLTTKWYELKSGGQSVAVLQLKLLYNLTYSIHRRDATSSLTIVPSQPAREFIRKELFRYARQNKITYRFIDYFLIFGGGANDGDMRKATMLERYPLADRHDFAIPAQLESFVFPGGFSLSSRPKQPICFSFRLNNNTDLHTDQTVAAVLCYWTKVQVTRAQREESTEDSSASPDGGNGPQGSENNREPSRSGSSYGPTTMTTSDDDPPQERARVGSATRRSTSALHLLQTKPEFQASSPLTPSYRVAAPSSAGLMSSRPTTADATTFVRNNSSRENSTYRNSSPCPSPDPIEPRTPSIFGMSPPQVVSSLGSSPDDELVTMYHPTALVILSRLSFVQVYKDILVTLYQHFLSQPGAGEMDEVDGHRVLPSEEPLCDLCTVHDHSSTNPCDVALRALQHHNQCVVRREQQQSEKPNGKTNAAPASATAQSQPQRSPPTAQPSPPPSSSLTSSSSFHRMDLTGMSSNAVRSSPTSSSNSMERGGHQPDISSLGSLPLPPTPVSAQPSPQPPLLPHHPDTPFALGSRPLGTGSSSVFEAMLPPVAVNQTTSTLPMFIPYQSPAPSPKGTSLLTPTAASPSASVNVPRASCNPSCCPCSCCTFRVCCIGLTMEQYILYLVDEVPLPHPGKTAVGIQVACRKYTLRLPASELDFPQLDFTLYQHLDLTCPQQSSLRVRLDGSLPTDTIVPQLVQSHLGLLQVLDIEVILLILRCILSEMKLVFHSSSFSLLHSVTESLLQLCFPFATNHIYIPILPRELYGMLEAPVSFIVGVESSGLPRIEEMLGVPGKGDQPARGNSGTHRHSPSPSHTPGPTTGGGSAGQHDLSNFAFIDIDLGLVELTMPPPPFPPTSQKSLIRNIRHLTKQQVWRGDEIGSASVKQLANASPLPVVPSHFGSPWHMHQHLDTRGMERSAGSATDQQLDFPMSLKAQPDTRSIDVSAAASTSPADVLSASPPTSAQLQDSTTPVADATSSSAAKYIVSSIPATPQGVTPAIMVSSDAHRPFDRAIRIEFLQFLASLIANYRDYLYFVSGATPVFDTPSFLSLKGRSEALPFLSRFLETQIFRDFLDRHVEFPSYLQDYLLYINSHGDEEDQQQSGVESQPQQDPSVFVTNADSTDATQLPSLPPKLFHATLPEPLDTEQQSALVYARTQHFCRLLSSHGKMLPDPSASLATPSFRSDALVERSWSASTLPILGLLAPGALRPDLPEKRRSRSNSVSGGGPDTPVSPLRNMMTQGSVTASTMQTPLATSRSAIFPPLRNLSLSSQGFPSGAHGEESISLGKNPSTLNHTLLFSKMYDGLNSSLSEQNSAQVSRVTTPRAYPTHSQNHSQELDLRKAGLQPVEVDLFRSVSSPRESHQNTTSIFQQAFDRYGPNGTGEQAAANSAAGGPSNTLVPASSSPPSASSSSLSTNDPIRRSPSSNLSVALPSGHGSDKDIVPIPAPQLALARAQSTQVGRVGPAANPNLVQSNSATSASAGITTVNGRPVVRSRQRQMSMNLLSKSDFERKKPKDASRLGQVIALLMNPRSNTHTGSSTAAHVDLGELSAVGELLALAEWRRALVDAFAKDLGLDHESAAHRHLPTSAFLSLSLLFNIALEECNTDSDYLTALGLLQISAKIFNLPGVEIVDTNHVGSSSSSYGKKPVEREYLRSVLKRQQLWRDLDFWLYAYRSDISQKLEHPPTPTSGAHTPTHSTPTSITSHDPQDRAAIVFEEIAGLIYLQLSMGVDEDMVRSVVASSCHEFGLTQEKRSTLNQLVANIRKTTQGSAQYDSTYTPQQLKRPLSLTGHSPVNAPTLAFPSDETE